MKNIPSKKGTVLIVEDDMLLSLVEERLVSKLGHQVIGKAVSGEEAIEKAKTLRPDVILMDISLKGTMDGIEAMKEIRKFSDTSVIFLSGNSDKHSIERAKKTNYVDYLIKPVTEHDLVTPLNHAIGIEERISA